LGDTAYHYYNEAAKIFDKRFEELGAKRVLPAGMGNDKDDEKYETAYYEWMPEVTQEL
jgi:sulfite reductase alpha subunit-like flavoprotein